VGIFSEIKDCEGGGKGGCIVVSIAGVSWPYSRVSIASVSWCYNTVNMVGVFWSFSFSSVETGLGHFLLLTIYDAFIKSSWNDI
jgi:hypothetical protein